MKALLVEDDPTISDTISLVFELSWPEVKLISSMKGVESIELVGKEFPDVVILDLGLPDMDGIEVLRRIKKINKDISVIMITAFADEKATKAAVKEGAYDYIMKPFDLAYLELSVLTKVINNIKG